MKTLKDFTPDIQAKIPEYIEKYTAGVFDGKRYESFTLKDAEALIHWNYEQCGFKKPVVLVAENPYEAQLMFNYLIATKEIWTLPLYINFCLKNNIALPKVFERNTQLYTQLYTYHNMYLFTSNVYSNVYAAYYKFINDELNIGAEIGGMLNSWNNLYQKSNVYSAIFSELVCIVSKYPKRIYRNSSNDLHHTNGPAVEWGSISKDTYFDGYYINGRNMPSWIFEKTVNNTLTKREFINEENEDIKAGIYELIESKGEGSMLSFLGAKEMDRKSFVHANGDVEEMILYKTTEKFSEEEDLNGKSPASLAWLKMTCASTGTNYLIPSDSSFDNCIDAAKFHRPSEVPSEINYSWNSRS